MPTIKFQTSDGKIIDVDKETLSCSQLIETMFEHTDEEKIDETPIVLQHVNEVILQKVVEWAKFHKGDSPAAEDDDNNENISSFDTEFFNVDQPTALGLVLAANFLDIKGLLRMSCMRAASIIKGKSPEEIRRMFNVEKGFTADEEALVRRENECCEEK